MWAPTTMKKRQSSSTVFAPFLCFAVIAALLIGSAPTANAVATAKEDAARAFFSSSNHTNNWAVLVDTSRFWFNYRHIANTLSFYRTVKRLGIPDSHIILMLADDMACSPRNVFSGQIYGNENHELDLYGDNIEVDYRGYEVTPESLLRVLTNRHPHGTPRSKKMLTDAGSNLLIFMTGHGGDEFLKFQDQFEIMSKDVADALGQMREKRRYNEVLFIAETCQAATMAAQFYTPNVLSIGSSAKGESSYSHHVDRDIGLSVIDRFTYHTLEFMEGVHVHSTTTANQLFDHLVFHKIHSTSEPILDNFRHRPLDTVRLTDFFGSVMRTLPMATGYGGLVGGGGGGGGSDDRFDDDASKREGMEEGGERGGCVGGCGGGGVDLSSYRQAEEESYRRMAEVIPPSEGGWVADSGVDSRVDSSSSSLVRMCCAALVPLLVITSVSSMYGGRVGGKKGD